MSTFNENSFQKSHPATDVSRCRALGQAPKVQSKRGRSNSRSKEIKTMKGIPSALNQWELPDSGLQGNLNRPQLGPLKLGDSCVFRVVCGATGRKTRVLTLWSLLSLEEKNTLLSLNRVLGVGGGLFLPQRDLTDFVDFPWKTVYALRSGVGVEPEDGGNGRRGRKGIWDWYIKWKKIV